jgi:rhodanese-related sulfurtransferase
LSFEADCADVFTDLRAGITGFTVIDTRPEKHYEAGHVPGALNIPHRRLGAASLAAHGVPATSVLITYCAGPHCNASTRGALRLSELGREVKEMPGGMLGWMAEGFPVASGPAPSSLHDLTADSDEY